jgi:hypothetical protein
LSIGIINYIGGAVETMTEMISVSRSMREIPFVNDMSFDVRGNGKCGKMGLMEDLMSVVSHMGDDG